MVTTTYRTLSGIHLTFYIHEKENYWPDAAGIYCFAHNDGGTWRVSYVGQARSFRDRIGNHERWGDARRQGSTHVLAFVVATQAERDRIEAELIRELQPPLNTQLK